MIRNRIRVRRGIGLLEVIACTALVAVLITPIAMVIRASGQSIARADGSPSIETDLRRGLRWIASTVRDGDVQQIKGNQLTIRRSNGDIVDILVIGGSLVMDDGTSPVVLVDSASEVQFKKVRRFEKPKIDVGITIRLRAIDPVTAAVIEVNSSVALPPQV